MYIRPFAPAVLMAPRISKSTIATTRNAGQQFLTSSTPRMRAIRIVSCRARLSAHFEHASG
jgi:hypothetical protein